jgi:TonB family protein
MLRVGIVHGRRIVEERLLTRAGDVTIGTSPRSTFIVPWDRVPLRWRLFEERGGRRYLRLAADMTARIAEGSAVTAIDARAAGEPARPIPLSDRARGKVTVGDTTVLFQLLAPPPPQPRPQLPLSVRRHVSAEIDRWFAIVLAFTALLHVAFVVYLRQVDWPRRPSLEEVPDRYLRHVVQLPRPKPPAPPTATPEPAPQPTDHPRPQGPIAQRPRPTPGTPHEPPKVDVSNIGLVKLLTARTADGNSPLTDVLSNGAVDQPLEKALQNVGGIGIASNDSLHNVHLGTGEGKVVDASNIRGIKGIEGSRDSGPVAERDVASRLKVDRPVIEGGTADLDSIAREIRSRRKAIAACYERALKLKPTLTGKLVVRFSITAAGTVSAVDIDDDSLGAPEVGACVRALVLRWRFAPPAEAPVELSFPFVFQAAG